MLVPTLLAALFVAPLQQAAPISLSAGVAHSSNRTGLAAALDVERPLSGPAAIRIGVGYVARGLNDSAQTCTAGACFNNGVNVRTDFVSFTALFVLAEDKPFIRYLAVGPYLAPRLRCSDVTVGDCDRVDTSDGGIVVETGAILAVRPQVNLQLRYERAMAATVQIPLGDAGGSTDLRYQTVSVALRVRLGAFGS